ncbi:MAG: hypothetical protein HWE25_02695 [Alphaproteobacteria bacterium]|nr:hypothetical protein [Alphaproteobacteria bacterium]
MSQTPVIHVLICRVGKKIPEGILSAAKAFNAKLYVAFDEKQVRKMLREQPIDLVLMGSGLSPEMRGAMVQAIAAIRSDLCIHMNGESETGMSFPQFVAKMLAVHMPRH